MIDKRITKDSAFREEVAALKYINQMGGHTNIGGLVDHYEEDRSVELLE